MNNLDLKLIRQRKLYTKNDMIAYQSYLENYLGRKLKRSEQEKIFDILNETYLNYQLNNLQEICEKRGLYVVTLTEHDGDCMFASLKHHKICDNIEDFRKGLAALIYRLKDIPNLLPTIDISLFDMFTFGNDIEYVEQFVMDKETGNYKKDIDRKFYNYDYNIMCQDLSNSGSWSKLPMELILRVVSWFFNVKITIIKESGDLIIDNVTNPETATDIYLGHLGELHYLPIDVNENDMLWDRWRNT